MPEASVNQKDHAVARKNDIGLAGQIAAVNAKSISESMKGASDRELRRCISRSYAGHHRTAPRIDPVHSNSPSSVSMGTRQLLVWPVLSSPIP